MFKCCQSKNKKSRNLPLGNVAMPIPIDINFNHLDFGNIKYDSSDQEPQIEDIPQNSDSVAVSENSFHKVNLANRIMTSISDEDYSSFNGIFSKSSDSALEEEGYLFDYNIWGDYQNTPVAITRTPNLGFDVTLPASNSPIKNESARPIQSPKLETLESNMDEL